MVNAAFTPIYLYRRLIMLNTNAISTSLFQVIESIRSLSSDLNDALNLVNEPGADTEMVKPVSQIAESINIIGNESIENMVSLLNEPNAETRIFLYNLMIGLKVSPATALRFALAADKECDSFTTGEQILDFSQCIGLNDIFGQIFSEQ